MRKFRKNPAEWKNFQINRISESDLTVIQSCRPEWYKNSACTFFQSPLWLLVKIEGHKIKCNFFVSRWINKLFDDYFQEFFSLSNEIYNFSFWSFLSWFVQVTTLKGYTMFLSRSIFLWAKKNRFFKLRYLGSQK